MDQLDLDGNHLALMMNQHQKNYIGGTDDDNEIEKLLQEYGTRDLSRQANLKSPFKRSVFQGIIVRCSWLVFWSPQNKIKNQNKKQQQFVDVIGSCNLLEVEKTLILEQLTNIAVNKCSCKISESTTGTNINSQPINHSLIPMNHSLKLRPLITHFRQ